MFDRNSQQRSTEHVKRVIILMTSHENDLEVRFSTTRFFFARSDILLWNLNRFLIRSNPTARKTKDTSYHQRQCLEIAPVKWSNQFHPISSRFRMMTLSPETAFCYFWTPFSIWTFYLGVTANATCSFDMEKLKRHCSSKSCIRTFIL